MTTDLRNIDRNPFDVENLVYIKRLKAEEASEIVPPNALETVDHPNQLFSLHAASGERIAIVEGRDAAFAAARANELKPLSLH